MEYSRVIRDKRTGNGRPSKVPVPYTDQFRSGIYRKKILVTEGHVLNFPNRAHDSHETAPLGGAQPPALAHSVPQAPHGQMS